MSKLELVKDLKKMLEKRKQLVDCLECNISALKDNIAKDELISENAAKETQEKLAEIRNWQNEFLVQYEALKIGLFPNKWTEVETLLEQCQKRLEDIEKYIEAVEFFKHLYSTEEKVQKLILKKQEQLAVIDFDTIEVEELKKNLECYVWLFQAFYETNPRKKFSFMYKLFPYFEEEIAEEVQFGTLILEKEEKKPVYVENTQKEIDLEKGNDFVNHTKDIVLEQEVAITVDEEDVSTQEVITEEVTTEEITTQEITTQEVTTQKVTTQENVQENVSDDNIWTKLEIINPEELIVKEDISLLQWDISDKANSRFSVKEFKKDMLKEPVSSKMKCIICAHALLGYTKKFLEKISKESVGFYDFATDKLVQLGYIKRCAVKGYGEFYVLSPKGEQIFISKEARSFLGNLLMKKESKNIEVKMPEDSTNAALTRILCYDSSSKVNMIQSEDSFEIKELRMTDDYFMVDFLNVQTKEIIVFVGITSENPEQFEIFYENMKKNYDENMKFVISGVNRENAYNVAMWVSKIMKSKVPVWYYGYYDENLYNLDTKEIVLKKEENQTEEENISTKEIHLEEKDSTSETPLTVENVDASEIQQEEKMAVSDEHEKEVIQKSTLMSQEQNKLEEKLNGEIVEEETHSDLIEGILSDLTMCSEERNVENLVENKQKNDTEIYQELLASGKLYCATAYVKSLTKTMPQYESVYRQLAYAINDPMEACSYNSSTIYDIYYNNKCVLSDHYVVAATMRNYFLDQFNYDYSLQHLHSMLAGNAVLCKNPAIDKIIYTLLQFKTEYHVGIDKYADYREKEQELWETRLNEICQEAKVNYETYILGKVKETTFNRRYIETARLLFSPEDDLGQYLQVVIHNDKDMLEELREFLRDNYIKDQAEIREENIDLAKVDLKIEEYWEKSKDKMNSVKKTSNLMSELRMNLLKRINKIVGVMANYVFLIDSSIVREDAPILHYYKKIRNPLLSNIQGAKQMLMVEDDASLENRAGNAVLIAVLKELEARLTGNYVEGSNKYFYIDFLKNDKVILDDSFIPVLDEVLELPKLSITNRIIKHSQEEEMTWEQRLSSIFNGEDDYGSATLILDYLHHQNIVLENIKIADFNVEKAIVYPQKDTENKRNSFIEELELAQSYGKIDNTVENIKETMVQIMDTWYAWANETMNYGFFSKILHEFYDKIENDAQVRAVELEKNLKGYLDQNAQWKESDLICRTIRQIQDRIKKQNYAAAEDLMNRLINDDLEVNVNLNQKDYLAEFFEEYDVNYRKTSNSGTTLKTLIYSTKMNKDTKGASRLIENWPKGAGVRQETMRMLLEALGFHTESVIAETPIQGKLDCFFVKLKSPENGRKSNYKHPIAAFGSEAEEKGFQVVCIFGKTDASRLIDTFKEIGNAKNTIVLLDYALTLADRRTLARKTKTDLTGKIFAVMDRVVLVYLAKHYVETAVNRMLMSVIMPFASYQPYIDKSADVMPQEMFIGRKNELEKIESPTGANIVYGGRQLGKTALLRMAKKDIDRNENGDRAIIVSVWEKNYRETAKIISQTLFDEGILKKEHITEDWNELARDIKNRLRDENDKIPYLLLMIDEADVFIESCEEVGYEPFEALKEIQSIGSGRFKFVVAGLRNIVRFKREATLGNNRGLTHLESVTVKPFKTMEARELLEVPLSYLGFRFAQDNETEVLISTIFGTTNYFPGLIQLYCTKLIEAVQRNYAGYDESETPPYIVQKEHIKKVLAEQTLQQDIREKFFITLKVGNDDYYYIIALMVAYYYHQNKSKNGCRAKDLLVLAEDYSIQKLLVMSEEQIWALMEEMCELNVLQHTGDGSYRFTRHSFCQMMGSVQQIDDELLKYME